MFEAVSKALTTSIISAETIKKKTNEKLRLIVQSEVFLLLKNKITEFFKFYWNIKNNYYIFSFFIAVSVGNKNF